MQRFALPGLYFVFCLGCGESIPQGYPVEGQVLYRKKPLAEATVTFHPKIKGTRQLSAITDAEGRFRVQVTSPDSGLPAGDYKVSIVLLQKRRDGDEEVRNGRNLLPARYADSEKSGFQITVRAEENRADPFVLTD